MSGSAHIRKRVLTSGKVRYQVRFRRGGRGFRLEHGGQFTALKEAKNRRDLIAGWLAQGKNPREELSLLQAKAAPVPLLEDWAERYEASRLDLAPESLRATRVRLRRVTERFGRREPHALTHADVQEWVADLSAGLKPASVGKFVETLRVLLDFADVKPNPARDKRVRVPRQERKEIQPPAASHVLRALRFLTPERWRLPTVVLEQTGMRVGEAANLTWGDVDVSGLRFRLPRQSTKTRQPRWVQVPSWLMKALEATCPLEDRLADRRVFPGLTPTALTHALGRACKLAKVPHFSAHDLRHRRISLWHGQGIPERALADRVGHSKPSMTLDRYSHVVADDEIDVDVYVEVLE